jgi:hypothetical protein
VNDGSAKSAGYQDALLCIRKGVLRIKWYYFPGGTKRISLTRIVGVEEYRMSGWTGRCRLWGSGDLVHWFPLDPRRPHKQDAFVIDVGRRAKPVVTPEDPKAFRAALAGAGVPLFSRASRRGRT